MHRKSTPPPVVEAMSVKDMTESLRPLLEDWAAEDAARTERDRLARLFNRLEAAVSHQKRDADGIGEYWDEALWKARDAILSDYASGKG